MMDDAILSLFTPLAIAFLIGAAAMAIARGNRWRRLFALCFGGAVYSLYDLAVGRLVGLQELPLWVIVLILAGVATVAAGRGGGPRRAG